MKENIFWVNTCFGQATPLTLNIKGDKGFRTYTFDLYPDFINCGEIYFNLEYNVGCGNLNGKTIFIQKIGSIFKINVDNSLYKFEEKGSEYLISIDNYFINFEVLKDKKMLHVTDNLHKSALIPLLNKTSPFLILKAALWNLGIKFNQKQPVDWRFVPKNWSNHNHHLIALIIGCYILRMYYYPSAFKDWS